MKHLILFDDQIEKLPELLSTVFAAARPWIPNSSLNGPYDSVPDLEVLKEKYSLPDIQAIGKYLDTSNMPKNCQYIFVWCDYNVGQLSIQIATFVSDEKRNINLVSAKSLGGAVFAYDPESRISSEVLFLQKHLIEVWGDPEMYDIAISFAAPERDYVRELAEYLKSKNILVFFDEYNQADMWGKDGLEYLQKAYVEKAKYVVMCLSQGYVERAWPSYERKQILGREFIKQDSSILPLRFDDVEIPELPPQYFYLNAQVMTPEEVGNIIIEKLSKDS